MIRRSLAHCAMIAVLSGCAAKPPPESKPPLQRVADAPSPSAWTHEASHEARSVGAGPAIEVEVRAAVRGDSVGGVMNVAGDQCLLALARGSDDIVDIDLFAFADDGTVLGTDEAATKDATILICPPHPRHVYLSARVASGHGVVAVVAHAVPPAATQAVTRRFSLGEGRGIGTSEDPWPALDQHLADRRRQLGGTWRSERRVLLLTDPRVATRASAKIARGSCLDALAVPSDEVAEIDLVALAGDGRIIARGETDSQVRSLLLCSPVDTLVTFQVRPHAGRGVVALLLSRSDTPEQLDLPGRHDVAPIGPLPNVVDANDHRLSQQGFDDSQELARGKLDAAIRTSVPLSLPGGCVRLDVVVGKPALGFEAWLWDDEGHLVSHGNGGATATLYRCGGKKEVRLDLDANSRGGPFVVQQRRLGRTRGAWTRVPLAAARLLSRLDAIGLLESAATPTLSRKVDLDSEHLYREPIMVPVGRCVTMAAAIGTGAVGVEITLREASTGQELAHDRGPHTASARVCALDVPGTLQVVAEVRAVSGSAAGLIASHQTAPRTRQ